MMDALVKTKADKGLTLQKMPMPEMGINDVLIKIRKTAICGRSKSTRLTPVTT